MAWARGRAGFDISTTRGLRSPSRFEEYIIFEQLREKMTCVFRTSGERYEAACFDGATGAAAVFAAKLPEGLRSERLIEARPVRRSRLVSVCNRAPRLTAASAAIAIMIPSATKCRSISIENPPPGATMFLAGGGLRAFTNLPFRPFRSQPAKPKAANFFDPEFPFFDFPDTRFLAWRGARRQVDTRWAVGCRQPWGWGRFEPFRPPAFSNTTRAFPPLPDIYSTSRASSSSFGPIASPGRPVSR